MVGRRCHVRHDILEVFKPRRLVIVNGLGVRRTATQGAVWAGVSGRQVCALFIRVLGSGNLLVRSCLGRQLGLDAVRKIKELVPNIEVKSSELKHGRSWPPAKYKNVYDPPSTCVVQSLHANAALDAVLTDFSEPSDA